MKKIILLLATLFIVSCSWIDLNSEMATDPIIENKIQVNEAYTLCFTNATGYSVRVEKYSDNLYHNLFLNIEPYAYVKKEVYFTNNYDDIKARTGLRSLSLNYVGGYYFVISEE